MPTHRPRRRPECALACRRDEPRPRARSEASAMAIGPRLDLRQSQTLVMTPQLRQAIKLLQFSNLEVARLRRGGAGAQSAARARRRGRHAGAERPALDQRPERRAGRRIAAGDGRARSPRDRCRRPAQPLDADCVRTPTMPAARRSAPSPAAAGGDDFEADERGVEDMRGGPPHAARASGRAASPVASPTRRDRLIGAHLIALLDPAGRLRRSRRRSPTAIGAGWSGWRRCGRG